MCLRAGDRTANGVLIGALASSPDALDALNIRQYLVAKPSWLPRQRAPQALT